VSDSNSNFIYSITLIFTCRPDLMKTLQFLRILVVSLVRRIPQQQVPIHTSKYLNFIFIYRPEGPDMDTALAVQLKVKLVPKLWQNGPPFSRKKSGPFCHGRMVHMGLRLVSGDLSCILKISVHIISCYLFSLSKKNLCI